MNTQSPSHSEQAELQKLRELVAPCIPSNPIGGCRKATDETSSHLRNHGYEIEPVEGSFRGMAVGWGDGNAYHWYIELPNITVSGLPVIVDPTVEQFHMNAYRHEDGVTAGVPPELIPDTVVITSEHDIYDAYQ